MNIRYDLQVTIPDRDDECDLAVLGHLIPVTMVSGLFGGWRIAEPGAMIIQANHDEAAKARNYWLRYIPGCKAEPITTLAAKFA